MKNRNSYKNLEELKNLFTELAHNDSISNAKLIENTLIALFGGLYENNRKLFENKLFQEFKSLKDILDFNEDDTVNTDDYKDLMKQLNLLILYHLFSSVNLVVMSIYDDLKKININKKNITDVMFKFILYVLLIPLLENVEDSKKFFSNMTNRLVIFNLIDLTYDTYTNYLIAENGYDVIKNKLASSKWFSCCQKQQNKEDYITESEKHAAIVKLVVKNVTLKKKLDIINNKFEE